MTGWRFWTIKIIALSLILIAFSIAGQLLLCASDSYSIHCVSFEPAQLLIGFTASPAFLLYPLLVMSALWPLGAQIFLIILISILVVSGWWSVRTLWFPRRR